MYASKELSGTIRKGQRYKDTEDMQLQFLGAHESALSYKGDLL